MGNALTNILFFPFNKKESETKKSYKTYVPHCTPEEAKNMKKFSKCGGELFYGLTKKQKDYWKDENEYEKLFIYCEEIKDLYKEKGWNNKKCFKICLYIYDKYIEYIDSYSFERWCKRYKYWDYPECIKRLKQFKKMNVTDFLYEYYDKKEYKTREIFEKLHKK